MIRRRLFQFSLRGFLAAITAFAILFGWSVEGARRRGRAIDAILAVGGNVFYEHGEPELEDSFYDDRHAAHFWNDLRQLPLEIYLPEDINLDEVIGRYIELAGPIQKLTIGHAVQDDALGHLNGLADGCWIVFADDQYLSSDAAAELEQRLPGVRVSR